MYFREMGKFLILLVDDTPTNLHVLAGALRSQYRIKTATSGPVALEIAARADKPDLILLDVMMPGMSGIEVLRNLRKNPETADIPVVFVSADASEQTQLEGLDLGADDYLTKPFTTSILRARVRNLLRRRQVETQLRVASHVFEYCGEAILVADRNNLIVNVNPAFTRVTGYTLGEVKGKHQSLLASERYSAEESQRIWETLQDQDLWQGEVWIRSKDGSELPELLTLSIVRDRQGEIDFVIASYADISEQKAVEETIKKAANHDALTGLSNRLFLQSTLQRATVLARRQERQLAVMFLDMDDFKKVNDTLGHDVGDGLLIAIAERLKRCVRESDLVARLGGDEFVVVLIDNHNRETAARAAEKILHELGMPYQISSHKLHSVPSIGISLFPQDGDDFFILMKRADEAMYRAKSQGGNRFEFFESVSNLVMGEDTH